MVGAGKEWKEGEGSMGVQGRLGTYGEKLRAALDMSEEREREREGVPGSEERDVLRGLPSGTGGAPPVGSDIMHKMMMEPAF